MKGLVKSYFTLAITALLLSSCMDQYKETTKVVSVSPFSTLQINSVFSVYLVQDTLYSVKIEADDDVVNQVEARVERDVLSLTDNNKQKWMNPENNKIKVYVHSPNHYWINASSSYSLYSTNTITSDELHIVNEGAVKLTEIDLSINCLYFSYWNNYLAGGKLTVTGKCENFQIDNYGLHLVNTVGLNARTGLITNYAKADSRIYASERLECNLHGTGNIYVYGNPAEIILKEHTSSGQVIRVN